jgi:uncharacterized protein
LTDAGFTDLLADLQHLIQLQRLDNASEEARRGLDELPATHAALGVRLSEAEAALGDVRQRLSASQTARRELEKELAAVQSRLSKYRDQLMEVKTNREYQAMQSEIATAEREVRSREDRILDHMEIQENLGVLVKQAEQTLRETQASVAAERESLERRKQALEGELAKLAADREALRPQIGSDALRLFDHIAKQRRGLGIVEARDGHCSVCQVRLRPQVYNEIRRNEKLIQCDSCQRLLYFAQTPAAPQADHPAAT